ncbi:MAG: hypothetical protein K0Q79_2763 [Flavipsychrobacter sp.]|jgi:hypothetical protein|nr:hypothetical protein [Flavipsychrobacter sp.]
MKYWNVKWFMRNSNRTNFKNYRGQMFVKRETKEDAEKFAKEMKPKMDCEVSEIAYCCPSFVEVLIF